MICRFFICILAASFAFYAYIDKQNDLTELRIAIPSLEKKVREVCIENRRLQYELDELKTPERLLKLAERPEMGYLQYPKKDEVIFIGNICSLYSRLSIPDNFKRF